MNDKLISILKGAGVAAAGAALTWLSSHMSGLDFGSWTPAIVAALSVAVNVVRKLLEKGGDA